MVATSKRPLRRLGALLFALQVAMILAVAVVAVLLYRQLEILKTSRDAELQAERLADELRESSDALTRTARTYTVTGEPAYRAHYDAITEIRAGTRPRPLDDGARWNLESSTAPTGPAIALHVRFERAGFTAAELAKLAEAERRSNELAVTERRAFELAATDRPAAITMLHDDAYRRAKDGIDAPITEVHQMLRARTADDVAAQRGRSQLLVVLLIGLVLAALGTIVGGFVILRRHAKRAESGDATLHQRLAFETLLGELSAKFLAVADDALVAAIADAQQRICEFFEIERSGMFLARDGDRDALEITQVYPSAHDAARVGAVAQERFPWCLAQLRASTKPMMFPDVRELPDEAAKDRETFASIGTIAVILVPWPAADGGLNGFISFSTTRARTFSETEIHQLATLGQVVLVTLSRARERDAVATSQERNRALTEILDEAPAGVLVSSPTGEILYANRHTAVLHGHTVAQLATLRLSDLYPIDARPRIIERVQKIMEAGSDSFTGWRLHRDGTPIHVHVRALRTQWGDRTALLSVTTDLTERDRADADIRKLSEVVEQSPESIAIVSLDRTIEYANEAYMRAEGVPLASLLGSTMPGPDEIWEALERGEPWVGDLAASAQRIEHATYAPLRDRDGRITQYIAIKQDVTANRRMSEELDRYRRHLEELVNQRTEELRRARDAADDANQAKSRFLANMSHEIRTPMNAVLGFAQLLLRDPALTTDQRSHLATINRAGDHLLSLIDGILQLAKVEAGHEAVVESSFDLWLLVADIENLFRSRADDKGLRLAVERAADVPRFVRADEGKLRQVIANLLGNAIKFTAHGHVTLRLASSAGRITWEVEDTGAGIAADELVLLFSNFEQTASGRASKQGTGLGLAISRELVRLMGGELEVRSTAGHGSTFTFAVPCALAAEADVASRDLRGHLLRLASGASAPRVLVADDNEDNRMLLLGLLSMVGFETRSCSDGEQAVRDFASWRPQLVLMDMRMPVLDGIEAIRRIRATAIGGAAKIICITASAFPEDERRVREAGADAFVKKPVRESALLQLIGTLLDVHFVEGSVPPPAVAAPEVTAAALARLPAPLRDRLRAATRSADLDGMLAIADEARAHDADVATGLRALSERYAYQRILELLEVTP